MNRHVYFRQQEKNYLAHHGIKGQKWGIRRYQNEDGTLTPEGRRRYGVGTERIRSIDDIPSERGKARYLRDMKKIDKIKTQARTIGNGGTGLTDSQKKAIVIGSIAAVGTLAVAGTAIYLAKSGKGAELINSGKNTFNRIKDKLTRVPLDATNLVTADTAPAYLDTPMDISKPDRNAINPNRFNPFGYFSSHMNCVNCSVAADLRSKGFDVSARMNGGGWDTNAVAIEDIYGKPFTKLDPSKISTAPQGSPQRSAEARMFYENAIRSLTGNEDGHGILTISQEIPNPMMPGGAQYGGHAINWCKRGDTITFIDNQTNSNLKKIFSYASPNADIFGEDFRPNIIRTDDVNVDLKKAGAFVIDRETGIVNSIFKGVHSTERFKGGNSEVGIMRMVSGEGAMDASRHIMPSHTGHVEPDDYAQIRAWKKRGIPVKNIAESFDVTPGTIYDILKGK